MDAEWMRAVDLPRSQHKRCVGADGQETWREPLVRWAAAALLHRYSGDTACQQDAAQGNSVITAGDVQRWAESFVTVSFGDPLFGSFMAWLLQTSRPADVQVCFVACFPVAECAEGGALPACCSTNIVLIASVHSTRPPH